MKTDDEPMVSEKDLTELLEGCDNEELAIMERMSSQKPINHLALQIIGRIKQERDIVPSTIFLP